eukprot:3201218-Pyramimonas_sp.AAC.1
MHRRGPIQGRFTCQTRHPVGTLGLHHDVQVWAGIRCESDLPDGQLALLRPPDDPRRALRSAAHDPG